MSFDNPWQWSSTAASNTAITSIDITGTTGLVKNGDNAIRAIMAGWATVEAKGSDVASAGTLTLGSQRYYHVTGTTTITDIDFTDAVDGRWAWLIFDGALTLTHNSTTLKLPGNANITTAAGDRALFIQDSSDNVICLVYRRAADGLVERGSGSNGEYVKFPDGTLICTHEITMSTTKATASGQLFKCTNDETWTFPVAFVAASKPVTTGIVVSGAAGSWVTLGTSASTGVTSFTFNVYGAISGGTPVVRLQAVGRWF